MPLKPSPQSCRNRLLFAENCGWGRGFSAKHWESRDFETGAEWLAWLKGYRQGQEELRQARAGEQKKREENEAFMLFLLLPDHHDN